MAAPKQQQGHIDDTPAEQQDEGATVASLDSSWVFIDKPATIPEVQSLLASVTVPYTSGKRAPGDGPLSEGDPLPPITMDRYLPYVLPMANRVKVKVPDPNNPHRQIDQHHQQVTLYTQVAGRLAILADVAQRNDWAVEITPEETTPTGMPGYLVADGDLLLFRVYVTITERSTGKVVGRRFGTASGRPNPGGFSAEASNPYETVETSALGRALAQWGFGVLPGSGIASVEELRLARANVQAQQHNPGRQAPRQQEPPAPEARGDLIANALSFVDRLRLIRGVSEEESDQAVAKWVQEKFTIDDFYVPGTGYDWGRLTDQQIALLRNSMRDAVMRATAAGDASTT